MRGELIQGAGRCFLPNRNVRLGNALGSSATANFFGMRDQEAGGSYDLAVGTAQGAVVPHDLSSALQ